MEWEWVIVEDGSTTAAKSVQEWDTRIRWANTPSIAGPASAINLAIAMAKAPLIRHVGVYP